jgi:hypothetical protein
MRLFSDSIPANTRLFVSVVIAKICRDSGVPRRSWGFCLDTEISEPDIDQCMRVVLLHELQVAGHSGLMAGCEETSGGVPVN